MMKKLCLIGVVLCMVVPTYAVLTPSLGPWNEGDAGATHQRWDFTQGYVTAIPGDGYSAIPEEVSNPDPTQVVATISPGSIWDGVTKLVSETYISVNLEIPNYDILNPYKEIWVDIGDNEVNLNDVSIAATPTDVVFDIVVVPGEGDAEFGVRIWPNPYVEKIGFIIFGTPENPVVLDYIHVDTLCIPEPATMLLLGLGGLLLRKRR